jgi:hypothetical protein
MCVKTVPYLVEEAPRNWMAEGSGLMAKAKHPKVNPKIKNISIDYHWEARGGEAVRNSVVEA